MYNARSAIIDYNTCSDWTTASSGRQDCPLIHILIGVKCGVTCSTLSLRCCQARGTFTGSISTNHCQKALTSYRNEIEGVTSTGPLDTFIDFRTLRKGGRDRFTTGLQCSSETACDTVAMVGRRLNCGDDQYLIEEEVEEGACVWSAWWDATTVDGSSCPRNMAVTGLDCRGEKC